MLSFIKIIRLINFLLFNFYGVQIYYYKIRCVPNSMSLYQSHPHLLRRGKGTISLFLCLSLSLSVSITRINTKSTNGKHSFFTSPFSSPIHRQFPTPSITLFNPILFLSYPQNQGFKFLLSISASLLSYTSMADTLHFFFLQKPNRLRFFSMAAEPKESPANNPGLHATPDEATKGYFMQQTVSRCFIVMLILFHGFHFYFLTVISIADVSNQGPQSEP